MEQKFAGIREKLLECYGLDIEEAKCFFSTKNYAFLFSGKPFMIRVSIGYDKTREETLSEILWVDDLKLSSETICEPSPSLNNNLAEEFDVEGKHYRAAMFRTAKGNVKNVSDIGWKDILLVGDLLGKIHKASQDAARQGITYKRQKWDQKRAAVMEKVMPQLDEKVRDTIQKTFEQVKALGESPEYFGMIHGDFHINNFFVDGNNIWVFDFDECCYGYFMYDIASILDVWLMYMYKPEKTRRQVLYEDILPFFKQGYEEHVKLPKEQWDLLELFMKDRQCVTALALCAINESGILADLEQMKKFAVTPLVYDDFLEGLDVAVKITGEIKTKYGAGKVEQREAKEETEDSDTIVFEGRITSDNAAAFEQRLNNLIDKGLLEVTVDCKDLEYTSSAGLRVFLSASKKLKGKLKLINVNSSVREVLEVTGLAEVLL